MNCSQAFRENLDASQATRTAHLLPAVLCPYPQPSALPFTQDTAYALCWKDKSVSNLRSAVNHQALLLPKARKHLILCFQLCQRKGPSQFGFCSGPEKFATVCAGDNDVGGQHGASLHHTTGKALLTSLIVFLKYWQIHLLGALAPRGRHP